MSSKIQKWGNSLGVRIPKSIIEKMKLGENSEVVIEHSNGSIVIYPKDEFSIENLLNGITKNNLHNEDDSSVEGNEVW